MPHALSSLSLQFRGALPGDGAIFVAPAPGTGQLSIQLIFPYRADRPALAHYVEHLVCRSAIEGKWGDTDRDTNAVTTSTTIRYFLSGDPQDLKAILGVLRGVFQPLALSGQQAADERDIVMREHDLDLENNIRERAVEMTNAFLYQGNGNEFSVIGSRQDIEGLSLADAQQFQQATHRPERAMLFASGEVTEDELRVALAASSFPVLASRAEMKSSAFVMPAPAQRRFAFPDDKTVPCLSWDKVVPLAEPVEYDRLMAMCQLLETALESDLTGSISKPLIYDSAVASSVEATVFPLDEGHVEFLVRAEPEAGVGLGALGASLDGVLRAVSRGVPAETFERLKNRWNARWNDDADFARGDWFPDYMLNRLLTLHQPKSQFELRMIDETMSLADFNALTLRIAAPGRLAIVTIGKDYEG